ncbi:hypothetical protein BASA60_007267 [Batrachochytrium salamandrivorans]|nr:hypothetical protein BASA60_007267 [Batrachochytrium salamandrivorans]
MGSHVQKETESPTSTYPPHTRMSDGSSQIDSLTLTPCSAWNRIEAATHLQDIQTISTNTSPRTAKAPSCNQERQRNPRGSSCEYPSSKPGAEELTAYLESASISSPNSRKKTFPLSMPTFAVGLDIDKNRPMGKIQNKWPAEQSPEKQVMQGLCQPHMTHHSPTGLPEGRHIAARSDCEKIQLSEEPEPLNSHLKSDRPGPTRKIHRPHIGRERSKTIDATSASAPVQEPSPINSKGAASESVPDRLDLRNNSSRIIAALPLTGGTPIGRQRRLSTSLFPQSSENTRSSSVTPMTRTTCSVADSQRESTGITSLPEESTSFGFEPPHPIHEDGTTNDGSNTWIRHRRIPNKPANAFAKLNLPLHIPQSPGSPSTPVYTALSTSSDTAAHPPPSRQSGTRLPLTLLQTKQQPSSPAYGATTPTALKPSHRYSERPLSIQAQIDYKKPKEAIESVPQSPLNSDYDDQDLVLNYRARNRKDVMEVLDRPTRVVSNSIAAKLNSKNLAYRIKESLAQAAETPAQIIAHTKAKCSEMGRAWVVRKWRLARAATLMGMRMTGTFKEIARVIQEVQRIPCANENSLLYMLQTYQGHADQHLSTKIKLACSSMDRSLETVEQLSKLLAIRFPLFAQFSTNSRLQYCRIMQFEQFPVGSLIIKEGHISSSYYILVSGQVELFIVRDGFRHRLNILNPGDNFGCLHIRGDINNTCASTLMDSEFIRIDKNESSETSMISNWQHIVVELARVPHFLQEDSFLKRAMGVVTVVSYEPNETIFLEGTDHNMIYWVISGECNCNKIVPFIQHKIKSSSANFKIQLLPCDPNIKSLSPQQIQDGDEIVNNTLKTHVLTSGKHFPDLPYSEEYEWDTEVMFDRHHYIKKLEARSLNKVISTVSNSVVAATQVMVAAMTCLDYARLSTSKMLLEILTQRTMPTITIPELQQAYIDKRKWDAYKKNFMKSLRK